MFNYIKYMFFTLPKNILILQYKKNFKIIGQLGIIQIPINPQLQNSLVLKLKKNNKNIIVELIVLNPNLKTEIKTLYTNLINTIFGVQIGYSLDLVLIGNGYRVEEKIPGNFTFQIGYTHPILLSTPKGIQIKRLTNNKIHLFCNNINKLSQVSDSIKNLRPIEFYKGKGIRDSNFIVKIRKKKKDK